MLHCRVALYYPFAILCSILQTKYCMSVYTRQIWSRTIFMEIVSRRTDNELSFVSTVNDYTSYNTTQTAQHLIIYYLLKEIGQTKLQRQRPLLGSQYSCIYSRKKTMQYHRSVQYIFVTVKAVFHLRVFHTYVHARKTLNPFQYYIWNEQLFT